MECFSGFLLCLLFASTCLTGCWCSLGNYEVNATSCGRATGILSRIVNGQVAKPRQFPWIARLRVEDPSGNGFGCSASFITPRHLLTAAHCLDLPNRLPIGKIFIMHGNINYEKGKKVEIQKYISHANFNRVGFRNDIAMLLLPEEVTFNSDSSTVCLPSPDFDYSGQNGIVAGWGTLESETVRNPPRTTTMLMFTSLKIYNDSQCESFKKFSEGYVPGEQICAYGGTTDACQGDSGGPFTVDIDGIHSIVGLVSYGYGCANPDYPAAFTKVSSYLDWINDIIQKPESEYTLVAGSSGQQQIG